MVTILALWNYVNYVIRLLFDLALAIGVWKKNIKYIWTWIGFAVVELAFLFIVVVIMALAITNNKKIGAILGVIASIIFLCGCIYVFHAFIKEIKQGGPRQVYSQVYYVAGASQPQPQVSTLRALAATTSDGAADVTQPRPNYISPL
ncbi:hypothetical protein Ocin01_08141 [Orchesella cincta]|uniref:Uncharacterized protein n=1 Tax=Orchesella cincta TaxID=48709 RepID=A0A1D2MZT7_ORCCI|nr:hypothetical protein Ocin01_08141 [Orchesella cincta]